MCGYMWAEVCFTWGNTDHNRPGNEQITLDKIVKDAPPPTK